MDTNNMMELSTNSMSSPATTNNPYSPTSRQQNLSYSPDHNAVTTKLSVQSPSNSQNSSDRQNNISPTNQEHQIVRNEHQHSVTNFINHSTETDSETDKSSTKFIDESQMKSNKPSPMDFQSNSSDNDNKSELKCYNQINKESSPTHVNNMEHSIKYEKNNEDKTVIESYKQRMEDVIERHTNQHVDDHGHHHLNQHHHNHHQQQDSQRENLNGNLPHEHQEHQNEQGQQLHSQQQYHSPHHLQDHHQQQQQHLHHQLQQHHHNLSLHNHQAHLQHLESQHHHPYKLYTPQYLAPPTNYSNAYSNKQNTTFKPYRMSNITNLKHELPDDGYETSATADGSHLTQNGSHMMTNQVMMPKCEISPPDDPYNFVDDDIIQGSAPPLSPGLQKHLRESYIAQCVGGSNVDNGNTVPKLQMIHGNVYMSSRHSPVLNSSPLDGSAPKKRGRKKKPRDERDDTGQIMNGAVKQIPAKERKKHDRFNGLSEEEVSKRTLPDHLANNLDIIIIGINPGLFAAYKGHHYAGPGNHFWKCLYLSGLTHEQMNAEEDYKLIDFGIGFTNMVERATKGSADLTRKEIKEGCRLLQEKLRRFRPKIAVFNGKFIFEVFSGKKEFNFGRQPECIEGTNTYMWVMPSSSARCAQLPRAADKVPFYSALKKFRDFLNGLIPHLDDSECVFTDPKFKACYEIEPKADSIGIPSIQAATNITDLSNNHKMLDVPGKKKRGRPKKIRGVDGEEPKVTPRRAPSVVTLDSDGMPKKKRGRPKKIKADALNGMPNGMEAISNSIDVMRNTNLGMCSNMSGQNRMYPSPMQSPNSSNTFCGMNNMNPVTYGSINSISINPNRPNSYNHQQSPQNMHSQPFSHSDLSSEISAAISSEHLGESPVPTSPSLGPPDFEPPNNCMPTDDNNTNECGFASPAPSTISEHNNGSSLSQLHSNNSTSYSPYRTTPNNTFMDHRSSDINSSNDNYTMQTQQRQQSGLSNSLLRQSISSNDQQHSPQQQQQHTTSGDVYKLPDVSAKSLSGLESLVDQIPSLNDSESASSNSSLTSHTLNVSNLTGTSVPISDSRTVDVTSLGDQYQNSCIYSGYPTNINSMPGPTTVNPSQIPQYSNSNYSSPNSSSPSNGTNAYGSLSSSFSVSSLTSSYPSSVSMNSYHSNLMAASTHHLGGTGAPMYMEPHIPMPVNPLYHPYSQHPSYTGYSPIAPPPTIHMPSPNYPYGYTNSGYGQPAHPTTHPAAGYLSNHHSMFDRIKPYIGYGGY